MLCFFFSSRRRHTRCLSDWSSDVCSSDLDFMDAPWACLSEAEKARATGLSEDLYSLCDVTRSEARQGMNPQAQSKRSEERRVGKECRYRWSTEAKKKKEREEKRQEESSDD